jgi:uncharacterized membrane protein
VSPVPVVEASVDVDVPVREAYEQWADFESFPEFIGGVESVTRRDDTHWHWVTYVGGRRGEFDVEVTELLPLQGIAWSSVDGTTHQGRVTFHELSAGSSRVLAQFDWEAGMDVQALMSDLQRYKTFVESR